MEGKNHMEIFLPSGCGTQASDQGFNRQRPTPEQSILLRRPREHYQRPRRYPRSFRQCPYPHRTHPGLRHPDQTLFPPSLFKVSKTAPSDLRKVRFEKPQTQFSRHHSYQAIKDQVLDNPATRARWRPTITPTLSKCIGEYQKQEPTRQKTRGPKRNNWPAQDRHRNHPSPHSNQFSFAPD